MGGTLLIERDFSEAEGMWGLSPWPWRPSLSTGGRGTRRSRGGVPEVDRVCPKHTNITEVERDQAGFKLNARHVSSVGHHLRSPWVGHCCWECLGYARATNGQNTPC